MILNKNHILNLLTRKKLEEHTDSVFDYLLSILEKAFNDKIKSIKNKQKIEANDFSKERSNAIDVLDESVIKKLPSWVRDDIENSQVIGSSCNVIQTSDGKKYHIKNNLNNLSGAEWVFFLNSVIATRYSTKGEDGFAHHIRKIHPSPKPPQLMKNIIEFFTKENEIVFDYFMGVGGTLLGAAMCNRRGIGIDLEPKYIHAYKEASRCLSLKEQITICGDSIDMLRSKATLNEHFREEKASLILIDPPYGDMLSRPKTGEAVKKNQDTSPTPFTHLKEDLGNMDWKKFLEVFSQSITDSLIYLKNGGHIVVFIKDLQPTDKKLNLLHADVIKVISSVKNVRYSGTKIWADQSVNLYPYGYPYSFVSNQIHQYILIFKKADNG